MTDPAGNPLRLMFVHAHPDDETTTTGATIARYAAEGVGVELITCTRGERGEMLAPDLAAQLSDPDPDKAARLLGAHRERELAGPARRWASAGPVPGWRGPLVGLGRDRRDRQRQPGRPGTGRR